MKLILLSMITFAALNGFAESSPGAFNKLKQMFDAGNAPTSIHAVHAELARIKSCAGSSQSSPNEISTEALPIKVTYTKPAFGPNFPSEVLTGIAYNSTLSQYSNTYSQFFSSYTEKLTSDSLELNTVEYYPGHDCYKDDNGIRQCEEADKTTSFFTSKIRMNGNYLVFAHRDLYAYCWK